MKINTTEQHGPKMSVNKLKFFIENQTIDDLEGFRSFCKVVLFNSEDVIYRTTLMVFLHRIKKLSFKVIDFPKVLEVVNKINMVKHKNNAGDDVQGGLSAKQVIIILQIANKISSEGINIDKEYLVEFIALKLVEKISELDTNEIARRLNLL